MMERLEQAGFGRLDSSHFGLWLNLDPIVSSHLGPEFATLALATVHFPIGDRHREFVDRLSAEDAAFAVNCFTAFAHERRHFHDLLATPYGSVLMRQYTRAGLLALACRSDLFLGSSAIAVPLSVWVGNTDLFELAHGVPAPSERLQQLHSAFSTMQEKLSVFNRGTIKIPGQFAHVDATSILEGLAILTQEREIAKQFGYESASGFRAMFRNTGSFDKYYGALVLCSSILGRIPAAECLTYCLLVSLCGNYQEPKPSIPRYPPDILITMLLWLREHAPAAALDDISLFTTLVDDFFEDTFGDDVQGMAIRASKVNQEIKAPFSELADQAGERNGAVGRLLGVFDNFCEVQAAFSANVMVSPYWYIGSGYGENIAALPDPVIFLESVSGLPVQQMEELYYVQTESRVSLEGLSPNIRDQYGALADREGVVRAAHVLSPRAGRFARSGTEYPAGISFKVPELDVGLWQSAYDEVGGLLRFLLEGTDAMIEPLRKTMLLAFYMSGVRVFSLSGELQPPPMPEDWNDPTIDPEIRRMLANPEFREALARLRAEKNPRSN